IALPGPPIPPAIVLTVPGGIAATRPKPTLAPSATVTALPRPPETGSRAALKPLTTSITSASTANNHGFPDRLIASSRSSTTSQTPTRARQPPHRLIDAQPGSPVCPLGPIALKAHAGTTLSAA